MSSSEQNNKQSDFLTEKIKIKPVNKKKLVRRIFMTAFMAVIFGLIACVTFLVLEPVISNWLNPEEKPQHVTFPEDQEEMSPEDMLAENLPEETAEPTERPEQEDIVLDDALIEDILSRVEFDLEDYRELYSTLGKYAEELNKYMVTVTVSTSNIDWFKDVQESRNQCSGLILENNGKELLILTNYSTIRAARNLTLTFYDDKWVEAWIKQWDPETDLAIIAADLAALPYDVMEEEPFIASLGSSNSRYLSGTPVIALGSPMGVSNSVGYGVITSSSTHVSRTDRNYKLLQTDIVGSKNASGVLFNLQGQVIGIITGDKDGVDVDNVINAYGITELKKIIENMSNGLTTPYLGIRGINVTEEANQRLGVPYGAYIREIDFDSPAMHAGILRGDVIVGVDDKEISTFNQYSDALMQLEPGHVVKLTVMRAARNEYREMIFNVAVENKK